MLGTKIYKPIEIQEQCDAYSSLAQWCNANNATIEDKGNYYECVEVTPPPAPTIDDIKQSLISAVQNHMDQTVQTRDYDNIASACSYGLSTVDKFRDEALACISWRDNVWNYCYKQLALFESGQREVPTVDELIAELPALEW